MAHFRSRLTQTLALVTVGVAIAGISAAFALGQDSHASHMVGQLGLRGKLRFHARPRARIRTLLPEQRAHFKIFATRARLNTSAAAALAPPEQQMLTRLGVNTALARTTSSHDGTVNVFPGNGAICLKVSPAIRSLSTTGCVTDAGAIAGSDVFYTGSADAPGKTMLAGLVGDGVSTATIALADGTTHSVAVQDNVYLAVLSGQPRSVTVNGATINVGG